ncbi:MAG: hypothetical protein ACD_4C00262G0002 [uncultured bacterium (gcode 4)]|uniref:Uncharacterized protein n=1 Tax=uncultured bacterium (gcode 4) TaxID=1234023 RepID=K2F5Y8_9BACT|nr:MAG: hypothetical protein ACD_4C00262G0002 [uncultured bacterium (gcode 4)]
MKKYLFYIVWLLILALIIISIFKQDNNPLDYSNNTTWSWTGWTGSWYSVWNWR